MLEAECHLLDVKLAAFLAMNDKRLDSIEFDKYVEKQVEISQLKYGIDDINNKIILIQDTCVVEVLRNPENSDYLQLIYIERIALLKSKKIEKEAKITECCKVKLLEGLGPIIKGIESVLQSCGLQRQAYHSCSFIGNHVHKMLKV
nr:uncharacterized protein LOC124818464 [Hydra vulgaris]